MFGDLLRDVYGFSNDDVIRLTSVKHLDGMNQHWFLWAVYE